jgi:hypothetical protein
VSRAGDDHRNALADGGCLPQGLAGHQPSPFDTRHRFPGKLVSHADWRSSRFLLRYRDVEELLAERERERAVSGETIRPGDLAGDAGQVAERAVAGDDPLPGLSTGGPARISPQASQL